MSHKLWGNDFIDNPVEPIMDGSAVTADEDDFTFLSLGTRGKGDRDEGTMNSRGECC